MPRPATLSRAPLALLVSVALCGLARAQCPAADAFEDNDSCATSASLPYGLTSGLSARGAASPLGRDDDFYDLGALPDTRVRVVDVLFDSTAGTLEAFLYRSAACTTPLATGIPTAEGLRLEALGNATAASDFVLEVRASSDTDCVPYAVRVDEIMKRCSGLEASDDALEENDTCGTSAPLGGGLHTGLFASLTDADYFRIDVPADEVLTVDQTYVPWSARGELRLFADAACQSQLDVALAGHASNTVSWPNTLGVTTTIYVHCGAYTWPSIDVECLAYDLNVSIATSPCLGAGSGDAFEDNDDCAKAMSLTSGTYSALTVAAFDEDYFEIVVQAGATATIVADFQHASGNIALYLYDHTGGCGGSLIQFVDGTTNSESVSYTNTWIAPRTVLLRVVLFGTGSAGCMSYDLTVNGSAQPPITTFCFGDGLSGSGCPCANLSPAGAGEGCRNSQGFGAILTPSGSSSVSADDLVLTVTRARPIQTALLLEGASPIIVPFKDGLLCTGNPTQRLELLLTDGAGQAATNLSIAASTGSQPGDSRVYQVWYRDPVISPCNSGSNFTSAVLVDWQ